LDWRDLQEGSSKNNYVQLPIGEAESEMALPFFF